MSVEKFLSIILYVCHRNKAKKKQEICVWDTRNSAGSSGYYDKQESSNFWEVLL